MRAAVRRDDESSVGAVTAEQPDAAGSGQYYFGVTRNNEGRAGGVFDALAHPTRREILRYLRTRDYVRAGALGDALGVVPSTLSGHLRVLRDAGLVESRRRGTEIQYRVQLTLLDEAILLLQGLRSGTHDPAGPAADAAPTDAAPTAPPEEAP